MSKVAAEVETIWRAPNAAGATQRRSPLRRFGLRRAYVAALRFLDVLVPPRALPMSPADNVYPRFPPF